MTDWIDISLSVSPDIVTWPGVPKPEFMTRCSISRGDENNDSNFFMNCHSGTHIDAPSHFVPHGKTVEKIRLEQLIGDAHVIDVLEASAIDSEILEQRWPKMEKVERGLFKTRNSELWRKNCRSFVTDFCAITEGGARWLMEKGVQVIGVDYLSVQRYQDSSIVHQLLLGRNIVLIEGLDLSSVNGGRYRLICLPLKLVGLEASPARVLLQKYEKT